MQLFEALFVILLAIAIARIIVGAKYAWLTYSRITIAGLVVLIAGLVMEGWRWQLLPAGIAFVLVILGSLKKSDTRFGWRLLGAVPLIVLAGCSAVLARLMPVVSLPTPAGPYGVGTFDLSITDPSRVERYSPGRKRELFIEVWYPASRASLEGHPVRTLFHDLYAGEFNRTSMIFGYLKQVDTHSHVNAPAARPAGGFPVLLFNHALDFGFTSQNLLLMEHLASHGYVVISIAHPYQTAKVNLAAAGTIFRASEIPGDIVLPRAKQSKGIVTRVFEGTNDLKQVSRLKSLLLPMAERYLALDAAGKADFVRQTLSSPGLEPFRQYLSAGSLEDFFYDEYMENDSLIQYWVQDNQFIADSLADLQAPIAGFPGLLDLEHLGVFGMSYGGAAAGEFCKIDSRCKAGSNLDGTQFGRHWGQKMPVPFLMFYNEVHQGGNDYAYPLPRTDFWDLRVTGASHLDFTDFAYLWPVLDLVGFSGSIDGMRMMEILDSVQLDFFDHYLKGKPLRDGMSTGFPEIMVRQLP